MAPNSGRNATHADSNPQQQTTTIWFNEKPERQAADPPSGSKGHTSLVRPVSRQNAAFTPNTQFAPYSWRRRSTALFPSVASDGDA